MHSQEEAAAPATVVLEQNSSPTAKQRIRKVAMRRVKIHSGVPGATSSMVPSASATPPSRPPAAPAGPNGPAASSRTEPRPTADPAHATRPTADPAQATRPSPSAETATWSATRSAATRSAATRSATRSTATGSTTTWKASTQCGCNARFIGQIHPSKDAHDTDIAGLIGQIHPGKDAHDTDVAGLIGQIHPGKGVADDTVIAGLIGQIHPGKGIADDTDIAGLVGQILPGKDIDAAEVPMQARGIGNSGFSNLAEEVAALSLLTLANGLVAPPNLALVEALFGGWLTFVESFGAEITATTQPDSRKRNMAPAPLWCFSRNSSLKGLSQN
eukprot:CAMPEP_0181411386 /NCGR_PEP_ID=MMETSP1110-20121109/7849_1 /TAXON_ID=174948 /ORGANISM="Symbiodinium sp., Strain CCMP421" /LENGTH=329 /DNA_ID=CAMNT_0023534005 /DNA_START=131 /DNA_END=1119 /DNA_ORIENTATION=-